MVLSILYKEYYISNLVLNEYYGLSLKEGFFFLLFFLGILRDEQDH